MLNAFEVFVVGVPLLGAWVINTACFWFLMDTGSRLKVGFGPTFALGALTIFLAPLFVLLSLWKIIAITLNRAKGVQIEEVSHPQMTDGEYASYRSRSNQRMVVLTVVGLILILASVIMWMPHRVRPASELQSRPQINPL